MMLYIYNVETAQRDRLLSNPRLAAGLTWTADNRLIYTQYEAPPNQTDSNLWVLQLDAHTRRSQRASRSASPTARTTKA